MRMKVTLSWVRASRYPGPGVSLLQCGEKSGMRASRSSGFLVSRLAISFLNSISKAAFSGEPLNRVQNLR